MSFQESKNVSSSHPRLLRSFPADDFFLIATIFLVNLISLCSSIYAGDSSLFTAASFSLGSTHPPGYPLFVLLGKLLTFLPFGNIAMKTNLVGALSATVACFAVYKVSMALTHNMYASLASTGICCISPAFFSEALKAEAYVLNSALAMIVFYLGLRILNGGNLLKHALVGFFIIGLGMGNQHTIGFMGLVFLFPLAVCWKEVRLKWIPLGIISFLLGFSVNLLLYLRSVAMDHSGGLIVYSYAGSWKDFMRVILRQAYSGSSTANALAHALSFGKSWYYAVKNSLLYIAFSTTRPIFFFLLAGLVGLCKKRVVFFYFIFAFLIWFVLLGKMVWGVRDLRHENVEVMSVYFLPAIPILYCLISVGFAWVLDVIKKTPYRLLFTVAQYALVALPLVLFPYSYRMTDADKAPIAYDYGRDMLSVLPVQSLLLNYSDNAMFITFYMRAVERLREDVLVIDTAGKKDVYGMESSPRWKYEYLYPVFYSRLNSSVKEINKDFAGKGKFFSTNAYGLTETVSNYYRYYPYIFSVALYPKNMDATSVNRFEAEVRKRFMANYGKTGYEHAMEVFPANDFLVEELLTQYGMNTLVCADFLKRDGLETEGNLLYARAFLIAHPEKLLWPYTEFLLKDGREREALSLLGKLKTAGGERGKFAKSLEERAIAVIRDRE